jgi:hypothetical protein
MPSRPGDRNRAAGGGEKPFYDEFDPEKTPIIPEVFERIAIGEPP